MSLEKQINDNIKIAMRAMGKLNKFFKENTLVNQDFIRDTKITVAQFLKDTDAELKVTGFKRLMLGA